MPPRETGFLDRTVSIRGREFPYAVYVPRNFDARDRWPVILFLHGAGERGTDGVRQMQIGVPAAIRAHPEWVPAVGVFPQAPPDERWLDDPAEAAMAALDQAIAEFHGDAAHVVLAGLSMGGYGAYHLALAHPNRFAALIVVCGGLLAHQSTSAVLQQSPLTKGAADPYAFTARQLRSVPIRLFHGEADPVIPVSESRQMAEALRREGADVRYTEYPGVGHNSWSRAFDDAELWHWLSALRKAQ